MNVISLNKNNKKSFIGLLVDREISHERLGRITAGISVIITVLLVLIFHYFFLIGIVGIGVNLIQSGITNQCLVKDLLIKLGYPGEGELANKNKVDLLKSNSSQKELKLIAI